MSSTFGSLTTVKLGIYAAQKGLDVTGNNITNINTNGYTRQRLDQVSLISGGSDRYHSQYNVRVGQGVLVNGVSQLRDPGLDISYRKSQADVGSADSWLAGLEKLAGILDEVGKGDGEQDDGLILNQLNDLRDLINKANTNGIEGYASLIRQSADPLCDLFNSAAKALAELKTTFEGYLKQDVDEINSILSQIQELNVAIRNSDIRGDEGLELRDQRNLLLDTLSQHMKIDVTYSMEDVGGGLMVEKLTVKLATGGKNTLIDGEFATKVSTGDEANGYEVKLGALRDMDNKKQNPQDIDPVTLGDTDLYGSLQSLREMLTEKGEYSTQAEINNDKDATVKRGIPYYQMALDSLANEFAEQMNALNQAQGVTGAGDLFMNRDNPGDKITAGNIAISKDWAEGKVHMLSSTDPNAPSDDRSNLARFLEVFSKEHRIDPSDIRQGAVGSSVSMSFEDWLLRTQSTLAEDQMGTTAKLNNYLTVNNTVYTDRDSVSGVDLNDEATNLMVYQKAYTAACRLMTVLEEALDSLINGMVV